MIMSGYEEKLHARAEELDETSELALTLGEIHQGAAGAGVDRQAVINLEAAIRLLGGDVPAYRAGSRTDRHPGSGYGSDVEFLEALGDAEDEIRDWLHAAVKLYADAGAALERALKDLERARRDLAAAYAMSTKKPCNGCHGAKAAAIADAEAAIEDAQRRIGICEHTGEILEALMDRLRAALGHVCQVPHDLGEAYELIHEFIRAGGQMPHAGRWVTGASPAPAVSAP
jgi:hypothetical protein